MTKFSKKLVSKCVYVLILKNTESSLLSAFMSAGGWALIHLWLQDGTCTKNWPLVKELLELLLMCPVDVERLKSNNIPKLVKSISKREDLTGLYDLANQLVERWLKIVKSETVAQQQQQKEIILTTTTVVPKIDVLQVDNVKEDVNMEDNSISPKIFYKISSVKDGKIIAKISSQSENVALETIDTVDNNVGTETIKNKKEEDRKNKEKSNHDRSKHKSSSSSRSNSSSKDKSSRDKSSRDKERSSSSSSSKDKSSRDKDKSKDRDRDKSRSNGSHKSSSSSSKSSSSSSSSSGIKEKDKEKQMEKDKATLLKVTPPSLKLGRIPKKSSTDDKKKDDKKSSETTNSKKSSISIEVRNKDEGRPKTVKVYNAKMRSTGLEETAKPPPPRSLNKKPSSTSPNSLPSVPIKRTSPPRETIPPPEKRTKIADAEDKPGAIKLIAAKPKCIFKGKRFKNQWNLKVFDGAATVSGIWDFNCFRYL